MEDTLLEGPAAVDPLVHVVLVEPQIPANTGNIARTCAALGASLHLVGTLGFSLQDSALRRAGLDYWPAVDLHWHPSLDALRPLLPHSHWFYFTARTPRLLHAQPLKRGDALVFGREDSGLPQDLLDANAPHLVRLPQRNAVRSINLSTCVGMATYEALRQLSDAP